MTTQRPKAIFFDMDDTILSDDVSAEMCWRQVCDNFAPRIENAGGDNLLDTIREVRRAYWSDFDYLRRVSPNLRDARRGILAGSFAKLGIEDGALLEEMVDSYMALKAATVAPIPGALDALRHLRQEGVGLALITNGAAEEQRTKVNLAGLEPLFEAILIEGEFGVGKPDPRVFQHSLERLQVEPAETWMVGDNLLGDVGGAQAVGIYGVWVDWRGRGLPENSPVQPERIVRSIVELVEPAPGPQSG